MNEKFKWTGVWWLPNKPDKKLGGELQFAVGNGALLKLFGSFEASNPEIILGLSKNGEKITLYRCFQNKPEDDISEKVESLDKLYRYFQNEFQAISQDPHPLHFFVENTFVGAHFQKAENIKFKKLSIRYQYLNQWTRILVLGPPSIDNKKIKIPYRQLGSIVADIEDYSVKVEKGWKALFHIGKEYTIEEESYINLEFPDAKSFDECLTIINYIQNFLTLGVGEPVHPITIKGQTEEQERAVTEIFYDDIGVSKALIPRKMLFTLQDIRNNFEDFLRKWIEISKKLKLVHDLFFRTFYNPHMSLENTFLDLVKALEVYHRCAHPPGKYINEKDYKKIHQKLVNAIPKNVDRNLKQRLKDYLTYGNEFSLRKRLKELFREYQLETFIENKKDFIDKVVNIRNYYTHYDEKKEGVAIIDELPQLIKNLKICIRVCLLQKLGFTPEEIENMV